jgi:hypothetical protein
MRRQYGDGDVSLHATNNTRLNLDVPRKEAGAARGPKRAPFDATLPLKPILRVVAGRSPRSSSSAVLSTAHGAASF